MNVKPRVLTTTVLELADGVVLRDVASQIVAGLTIWRGNMSPDRQPAEIVTASSQWGVMAEAFDISVEGERVIAASPNVCEALKALDPEPGAPVEIYLVSPRVRQLGQERPAIGDSVYLVQTDAEDDMARRNRDLKEDVYGIERRFMSSSTPADNFVDPPAETECWLVVSRLGCAEKALGDPSEFFLAKSCADQRLEDLSADIRPSFTTERWLMRPAPEEEDDVE